LIQRFTPIHDTPAILSLIATDWKIRHLLVVGDVMLDKYIWGDVERISPEAPIPIVSVVRSTEQPGGAANVAMNLAALGAQVTLAGVVGDDGDGWSLRARLKATGMQSRLTRVPGRPTTSKTRILGGRQQMLRLDLESSDALPAWAHAALLQSTLERLSDPADSRSPSAIILSDYAKGVLDADVCQTIIGRARSLGIPVIVDPKSSDFSRYRGATMLCPNLAELALATGNAPGDMAAVLDAGAAMLAELQVESLAVTLSERGIVLLDGKKRQHAPALARQVFDVSGAGDTVTAVLALCRASNIEGSDSIRLANLAAGIVVGKVGTAPVHAHELMSALTGEAPEVRETKAGGRVFSLNQMTRHVETWRAAGDRVVFTNGCFDLLHAGHIALLEAARALGDRLVVGLNSDASIHLLKGPARPVNGEENRARLLAALSAVDGVVIFEETTPLLTVLALRPDVLVKGGDYDAAQIIGAREVKSWGGEVVIVPLLAGLSTTRILAAATA
jgi:D-beta-D-heptose 7-phosphate kinase/D-beta-D-heptose 1-phosphate adenosyltransferase